MIQAPREDLKEVERVILRSILDKAEVHPACHGFRKGRSIFTNAMIHQGQDTLATCDFKNCFSSIRSGRVYGIFRALGADELQAAFMTDICTCDGWLATGAPTSPALLNLICRRLDARLNGLMKKYDCEYSRYSDDLAFSGQKHVLCQRPMIQRIINEEGLEMSPEKTRIQPKGYQHKVAGVIVNDKLSVPREYRRRVRATVDRLVKGGIPHWEGKEIRLASLRGRIAFIAAVKPEEARRLSSALLAIQE